MIDSRVVSQARIFPYLGPAAVLYLTAGIASAAGALGAAAVGVAVAAGLLSLGVFAAHGAPHTTGARRVGLLAFGSALALLSLIAPGTSTLGADLASMAGVCMAGALVVDLAFTVPDEPPALRSRRALRSLVHLLGVLAAAAAAAAAMPVLELGGELWLVPARWRLIPVAYATGAVILALALRATRRRLGSAPEALASNAWGMLGLVPAALALAAVSGLLWTGWARAGSAWVRGLSVIAAALVVGSHVLLIDSQRRLSVGTAMRGSLSAAITLALVATGVGLWHARVPREPVALALAAAATLLVAVGLFLALSPLARAMLAPFGGRLIDAVAEAEGRLRGAHTLGQVSEAVLGPLRLASASPEAAPLLFTLEPAWACRLDAAGQAHLERRSLPEALQRHLLSHPRDLLLRDPLEASRVRRPDLRELADELQELDALCVVPLAVEDELEGALIVPRGKRRSALTLEEIDAMERLAKMLAGVVNVLCARERAHQRAAHVARERERAEEQVERLEHEIARLRGDAERLRSGRDLQRPDDSLVAYSPAMRRLKEDLERAAPQSAPLALWGETGIPMEPLARWVHRRSGRGAEPLVVADCSAMQAEQAAGALFGGVHDGVRHAGWLQLAEGGTLLLLDAPALPTEVQRELAEAIATRQARRRDGGVAFPMECRLIVTARAPVAALVELAALDEELARWLEPLGTAVPPLRERVEDLPSLILLALDRAARVLGRDAVGIEPSAQKALQSYEWPGNLRELGSVVERAVARCRGSRVHVDDLPASVTGVRTSTQHTEGHPLHGRYDTVERRLLQYALERSGGNKSEAARMLGLKRTTFLDKLRRHRLEAGSRSRRPQDDAIL